MVLFLFARANASLSNTKITAIKAYRWKEEGLYPVVYFLLHSGLGN
jgi:hypothetical protein